jgi:hypothetical protein
MCNDFRLRAPIYCRISGLCVQDARHAQTRTHWFWPKASELRSIQYQSSRRTLLNEIKTALADEGEPPFLPWTLSRIGAFYLPSTVRTEDEVRLLIKRYAGGPNPVLFDGRSYYWPLPIGVKNDFCKVDIVGIQAAPNGSRTDIDAAIAGTPFASVPVTGP